MAEAMWGRAGAYEGWFAPPQLGTRRPAKRPGCACPPTPYNPTRQPETNPDCPTHGDNHR
jgi:hypothetical protein